MSIVKISKFMGLSTSSIFYCWCQINFVTW